MCFGKAPVSPVVGVDNIFLGNDVFAALVGSQSRQHATAVRVAVDAGHRALAQLVAALHQPHGLQQPIHQRSRHACDQSPHSHTGCSIQRLNWLTPSHLNSPTREEESEFELHECRCFALCDKHHHRCCCDIDSHALTWFCTWPCQQKTRGAAIRDSTLCGIDSQYQVLPSHSFPNKILAPEHANVQTGGTQELHPNAHVQSMESAIGEEPRHPELGDSPPHEEEKDDHAPAKKFVTENKKNSRRLSKEFTRSYLVPQGRETEQLGISPAKGRRRRCHPGQPWGSSDTCIDVVAAAWKKSPLREPGKTYSSLKAEEAGKA